MYHTNKSIYLWAFQLPLENPLPLTVWTLWWGGLTALQALIGNIWAVLNPWIAPARLLRMAAVAQASRQAAPTSSTFRTTLRRIKRFPEGTCCPAESLSNSPGL